MILPEVNLFPEVQRCTRARTQQHTTCISHTKYHNPSKVRCTKVQRCTRCAH